MIQRVLFTSATLLLLLSCSSDSSGETQIQQQQQPPTACFEASADSVQVGEEIQLTNCSNDASTYTYTFGNGTSSMESAPTISYAEAGEYTITLEVTSASGATNSVQQTITVNAIEGNYLHAPVTDGDLFFPIQLNTKDGVFAYIENFQNVLSPDSEAYNYVEMDLNDNSFSKRFLGDRENNSSNAFVKFLDDGNPRVYTVRSLTDRIGLTEINLDANWENPDVSNQLFSVFYGYLENEANFLLHGAWQTLDNTDPNISDFKRPTIEIRDGTGTLVERKVYEQIEQGFIGDLIATDNGFIAFGGITEPINIRAFENYRPLIIFLDSDLDYVSHSTYDNSGIVVNNFNDLNGAFHIGALPNSTYVLYSHNQFRIISADGNELVAETFPAQSNIQGLVVLESGDFVLSTEDYLRKYNSSGNLLQSLKFNGAITPNLILSGGRIYFASGFPTTFASDSGSISVFETFFGAVDTDLNIIDLNNN